MQGTSGVSLTDELFGIRRTGRHCGSLLRAPAETRQTPCIVSFFSIDQLIWKPAEWQETSISLLRSSIQKPRALPPLSDPQRSAEAWRIRTLPQAGGSGTSAYEWLNTCSLPATERAREDGDFRPGHRTYDFPSRSALL